MSNTRNINSKSIKLLFTKLKRKKIKKQSIYYITKKNLPNNANIIGHTFFKNPNVGDNFFVYDGTPYKLVDSNKKNIIGYIPISTSEFIAIHGNNLFFIMFILLIFMIIGVIVVDYYYKPEQKDDVVIDSGGYDVTDDDKLRENTTDETRLYAVGYDHVYLTGKDSYMPLQSSEKNVRLVKFQVYNENMELLFTGINVEPGKEDRFYHNGTLKEGDNKVIVKMYEVLDNDTLGNSVTYETIINYKLK